ncbi:hypothetical protein [Halobacterium litoreum]|uniref:Lipoprotein n=1 Tax=Halobacterium litoreum TaxID=2039234 RepID=A0ABD5NGU4_9EURY|nr:hypothetical protein [Halobacterium litoreum]UHH12934.1 hypothetical protein LT972_12300 [Halobacterium litoreum]
MRRRTVLAAASTLLTAGCLGAGGGDGPSGPGLVDTDFELVDAGCGVERESASVSASDGVVTVAGTTTAPNGCYTAELADATDADGELRVVVAAVEREDVQGCAQCITELDYEATATFDGGLPERVVVVHRSRGGEREVASVAL